MNKDISFKAPSDILSQDDFLKLGLNELAYIKPYTVNQKTIYVVHGADGTALSALPNEDIAQNAIMVNDLENVTIH